MTRKHYIKIAEAVAKLPYGAEKRHLIYILGVVLKEDNAAFDLNRFTDACFNIANQQT